MDDEWLHIRVKGCENSTVDKFVEGPDTSLWHVSGEGYEAEGVMLLPNPTGMYDTPMTSVWATGNYGRVFQGFRMEPRDMSLAFQVYAGYNGEGPDDWRLIDSEFRMAWAPDKLSRVEFETDDGVRFLDVMLLNEPTSYGGQVEDGQSPFLRHDATVTMPVGGPSPNFHGDDVVIEQTCESVSGSFDFEIRNEGDQEMWPRWTVSSQNDGSKWVFPDHSYGNNEYLRAEDDKNRTWTAPTLIAGEHTVFDSDPRVEFARSNLSTNVWARCDSQLLYPIPPHTKTTVSVTFSGATIGDSCRLRYHPEFSRPWGVSRTVNR